jgi:uncharacterized protein DUF6933
MLIVRATKKLLDRVGPRTHRDDATSSTLLGEWYATVMFWRPQIGLFVNETTLLPVLMPLAPTASLLKRFPDHLAATLTAHGAPQAVISDELERMREHRLAKTASRSVVGVMNEFINLAHAYRGGHDTDLLSLSIRLSQTPCGPLYKKHISPDRELHALLKPNTSAKPF